MQDNHSRSVRGTVRALHFQLEPGQAKLVRAARGAICDVAVDLRRESPTYGTYEAFELTDENARQIFVPVGFAHGFCVTSETADVTYKVSSYYDGATERGIAFDDPAIGVAWPRRRATRLGARSQRRRRSRRSRPSSLVAPAAAFHEASPNQPSFNVDRSADACYGNAQMT